MRKLTTLFIFSLALVILTTGCEKENTNLKKSLIVYISTADHQYGEVYLCNGDGSGAKRISSLNDKTLGDVEYYPEFSPDGKKITFRNSFTLQVYDIDKEKLVRLSNIWTSTWSKDGDAIAYLPISDMGRQIWLVDADGTNERQLTNYYSFMPGDTVIYFGGVQWHPTENKIIARGFFDNISQPSLVKIDAVSGLITEIYPLRFAEEFTLRGNKITWVNGDSVFVHDMVARATSHFIAANETPKNPVLSPDGSRVAYTSNMSYTYNGKTYVGTEIVTCNLTGFDKRIVTTNSDIENSFKYKSSFYPFWISNRELLYSAGNIYKVKDDVNPSAKIIGKALQAGGQLQSNNQ